MGLPKSEWSWLPHPAHFICSQDCRFHLATYVGGFIVSTVGEYFPDAVLREILATTKGVVLEGRGDDRRADYMKKVGFEDIGAGRKYETMVFPAKSSGETCCPWEPYDYDPLDTRGYNDPGEAARGHLLLCEKWAMGGDEAFEEIALAADGGDQLAESARADYLKENHVQE